MSPDKNSTTEQKGHFDDIFEWRNNGGELIAAELTKFHSSNDNKEWVFSGGKGVREEGDYFELGIKLNVAETELVGEHKLSNKMALYLIFSPRPLDLGGEEKEVRTASAFDASFTVDSYDSDPGIAKGTFNAEFKLTNGSTLVTLNTTGKFTLHKTIRTGASLDVAQ
jgi:hypothetical protein